MLLSCISQCIYKCLCHGRRICTVPLEGWMDGWIQVAISNRSSATTGILIKGYLHAVRKVQPAQEVPHVQCGTGGTVGT